MQTGVEPRLMVCYAHAFWSCIEGCQSKYQKSYLVLDCLDQSTRYLKQNIFKMSESKTERGTLWGEYEIWVDKGIQQQLGSCTRKWPIFEKIAQRLQGEGEYIRTFAQVNLNVW